MPATDLFLLGIALAAFVVLMAILAWNVGRRVRFPRFDMGQRESGTKSGEIGPDRDQTAIE